VNSADRAPAARAAPAADHGHTGGVAHHVHRFKSGLLLSSSHHPCASESCTGLLCAVDTSEHTSSSWSLLQVAARRESTAISVALLASTASCHKRSCLAEVARDEESAGVCVAMTRAPHSHFAALLYGTAHTAPRPRHDQAWGSSSACRAHERPWWRGVRVQVGCVAHTRRSACAQARALHLGSVRSCAAENDTISAHPPLLCARASSVLAILLVVGSAHVGLALEHNSDRVRRAVHDAWPRSAQRHAEAHSQPITFGLCVVIIQEHPRGPRDHTPPPPMTEGGTQAKQPRS
jgi:hypothetical protein